MGERRSKADEPDPAEPSPIPKVCLCAPGGGVVMRYPSGMGGGELIAGSFETSVGQLCDTCLLHRHVPEH